MLFCCCANPRKDNEAFSLLGEFDGKLRSFNKILLELSTEEYKLGLKDVPCIGIIEKILVVSNKGEVPKKDLVKVFKSFYSVN